MWAVVINMSARPAPPLARKSTKSEYIETVGGIFSIITFEFKRPSSTFHRAALYKKLRSNEPLQKKSGDSKPEQKQLIGHLFRVN